MTRQPDEHPLAREVEGAGADRPPRDPPKGGGPGAAHALREAGEAGLELARGKAGQLREWLASQDRHTKHKAFIVGSWAILSVAAFAIGTSSGAASNELGAHVAMRETALSWALLVHNRSEKPWEEVRVLLDGGHVFEKDRIEADEMMVLGPGQFRHKGDGSQRQAPPVEVEIRTRGGRARPTLALE